MYSEQDDRLYAKQVLGAIERAALGHPDWRVRLLPAST